jgi:hypothetical protein
MRRPGRVTTCVLLVLLAGAAGYFLRPWLARMAAGLFAKGGGARPVEADRTFFVSEVLFTHEKNSGLIGRRRADAARDMIAKGTPIAEVARAETNSVMGQGTGGFMGAVPVYFERPNAFHGAVQILTEGQLAHPIVTDIGWHVLYRHPYEEGRELDQKTFIPAWAFRITWRELESGADRSKDEARDLAQKAVRDLRAGTLTFAQARAQYATPGIEREDGWYGRLDNRKSGDHLYAALQALPAGAYAEPIEATDGWVVMRRGVNFKCVVRQILVQHIEALSRPLGQSRSKNEALLRAQSALERARADLSRWPDIVRANSDDEPPMIDDQGSFGCISPGQLPLTLVPLEDAIHATPPGTLHPKVLETKLGYHVLWRVD